MERIEMVEKLRERANITMEEAKAILEKNNWDMLDAMVELERAGKIHDGASATSEKENIYEEVNATFSGKEEQNKRKRETKLKIKEAIRTAFRITIDNKLVVMKDHKEIAKLPLLVPVIAALASVGTLLVVLVVGMAFGLRYTIEGKDADQADITGKINETMDKAGEYTRNVVNSFTEKVDEAKNDVAAEEQNDSEF